MTRVRFDVITKEHRYPLAREDVRRALEELFNEAPDMREVIRSVRFGCSRHTAREGGIVQHGRWFDIRINFCLKEGRTRLLSTSKTWLRPVTKCGGAPDLPGGQVVWSNQAAATYAVFILFHEVAHVVYMRRSGEATFGGKVHGAPEEERFCDEWALKMSARWTDSRGARRDSE